MGTFVVKGRPTWLGAIDMSQTAHIVAIDYGAEAKDDTVLTDTTRSNAGGLKSFGFSMDAYGDFTVVDGELDSYRGNETPLTFASVDGTALEVAFLINSLTLIHSPLNGTVGDMAGINVSGNAADRLVKGIIDFNGNDTTSGTSTGSQLGAVSATEKIYANLHCTAASAGDTLDVIVQSDDNAGFTSATNRITFSQVAGGIITSEYLTLAGAITDDHWRISYTIAGSDPSFTFAVALGIA